MKPITSLHARCRACGKVHRNSERSGDCFAVRDAPPLGAVCIDNSTEEGAEIALLSDCCRAHLEPCPAPLSNADWLPITRLPSESGVPVRILLTDESEMTDHTVYLAGRLTLRVAPLSSVIGWLPAETAEETALRLVTTEMERQVSLGFDPDHDDCHTDGSLAKVGILYARAALGEQIIGWPREWTRPRPGSPPLRSLTKAAALILKEIARQLRLPQPLPPADAVAVEPPAEIAA